MGKYLDIPILFEDNHLLVVEKPVGMLSQGDSTGDLDLLTTLKAYLKEKYQKPGNAFLGLVHRLDRMTGGVMVFAKTSKSAKRLSEAIRNHEMVKKYLALVHGVPKDEDTLVDYLKKDEKAFSSFVSNEKEGKKAVLSYQVLESRKGVSLIEIELKTGRHHQIRVQFSSRGYPLVGDVLYGAEEKVSLALFAYHLSFPHPITKEMLSFESFPKGALWDGFNFGLLNIS